MREELTFCLCLERQCAGEDRRIQGFGGET